MSLSLLRLHLKPWYSSPTLAVRLPLLRPSQLSLIRNPHIALLQRQPALADSLAVVAQSQKWPLPPAVVVHGRLLREL